MNSEGIARLVSIDGAATVLTLDLAPDAGCEWIVVWAFGYHDDTVPPNINWRFTDSNPIRVGTPIVINFGAVAAPAANTNIGIMAFRPDLAPDGRLAPAEPLILTHNVKATLVATAFKRR